MRSWNLKERKREVMPRAGTKDDRKGKGPGNSGSEGDAFRANDRPIKGYFVNRGAFNLTKLSVQLFCWETVHKPRRPIRLCKLSSSATRLPGKGSIVKGTRITGL